MPCPAPYAKIFLFPIAPNQFYNPARLTPTEGRIAIVTDAGWDAVDAAALARNGIAGRFQNRERSSGAQTNGANADGEVVWSDAGVKFAEASRPDRARTKP